MQGAEDAGGACRAARGIGRLPPWARAYGAQALPSLSRPMGSVCGQQGTACAVNVGFRTATACVVCVNMLIQHLCGCMRGRLNNSPQDKKNRERNGHL